MTGHVGDANLEAMEGDTPLRVLHCPTNVGGNPQHLARAEREVGLQSWAVSFEPHQFGYRIDEVLAAKEDNRFMREWYRWKLLRRALREFDVVHFNFGCSMMPPRIPLSDLPLRKQPWPLRLMYALYSGLFEMRDLAWLKRAGVGVAVTYQGDDARQGDYCRSHFATTFAHEVDADYYTISGDQAKRRRIEIVDKWADRIYSLNPDLLHVLPVRAEFLPYASIDLREWTALPIPQNDRPVVVHAPTHRGAKGTVHILNAVSSLQQRGIDFEFVLVENLSHAEARKLYERATILVDQLLAGWYGGLAVELMALGRPVIAYIRPGDLKYLPDRFREELPIIEANPSNIANVLEQTLTACRHQIPKWGAQSRAFVERWHDPFKIAARLKLDYEHICSETRQRAA